MRNFYFVIKSNFVALLISLEKTSPLALETVKVFKNKHLKALRN